MFLWLHHLGQIFLSNVEKYEPSGLYTEEYFAYLKALSEEYVFTKEKKGIEIAQKIKDEIEAIEIGIYLSGQHLSNSVLSSVKKII